MPRRHAALARRCLLARLRARLAGRPLRERGDRAGRPTRAGRDVGLVQERPRAVWANVPMTFVSSLPWPADRSREVAREGQGLRLVPYVEYAVSGPAVPAPQSTSTRHT